MSGPVEYQVTSDIPMPEVPATCKVNWRTLKVGDSFYVARPPIRAQNVLTWPRKKYGYTFMIRAEGKGSRIWRKS